MPTPITAYTDIVSLVRAKNYLRIDEDLAEDDTEITSMINGAFKFLERYTNHIFVPMDFTQSVNYGCYVTVYNFPINSTTPENAPLYSGSGLKSIYALSNITYNAGYVNVEDVPDDFIQAVLQMLKVWYFESEKQVNSTLIPISVTQVIDTYRRFV